MNRTQARELIMAMEPDFLEPAKKIGSYYTYVCPRCGNGQGKSKTGIELDTHNLKHRHYKCFGAGCDLYEDVVGLYMLHAGISSDKEAFDALYDYYGIQVDGVDGSGEDATFWADAMRAWNEEHPGETWSKGTNTWAEVRVAGQRAKAKAAEAAKAADPEVDYLAFYKAANRDLEQAGTHRGISLATLNRFWVGYVEEWRPQDKPRMRPTPRLIIPTSKQSYFARDISPIISEAQKPYAKYNVGSVHLFNAKALQGSEPVFVTEGAFDALSIVDVGGAACALSGTSIDLLIRAVKQDRPAAPLIIALDNDGPGQTAADKLAAALQQIGLPFYQPSPESLYGDFKDANARLNGDREGLTLAVKLAIEAAHGSQERQQADYAETSAGAYMSQFVADIAASVDAEVISTGFPRLDKALEGGLYEGLYCLGAVSSLGKSTFVLQMADQIAQAGADVMIISLEMPKRSLIAKSISRLTMLDCVRNGLPDTVPKTSRGITIGARYRYYSQEELEAITRAEEVYAEYGRHIFIREAFGSFGVAQIREAVELHVKMTGRAPVVVVDYLQILAPVDMRSTDKQNTDAAVVELRRLARDFQIPVIAISSFNRRNYEIPVAMDSFKESGAIEYTSDVLFGLQFEGAGESGFSVEEAKSRNPRTIQLCILKNREGETGRRIEYRYYPMFNYFEECKQEDGELKEYQ